MGMTSLPPGVQNAEKADLRAQVLRICCNRLQGLSSRSKQEVVHLTLVLQAQLSERFWQRKDDMKIFARQEFSLTFFQPLGSAQGLTLGAMAIRTSNGEISITCVMPRRGNLWVIDELQAAVSVRNRRNFRQVESKDL